MARFRWIPLLALLAGVACNPSTQQVDPTDGNDASGGADSQSTDGGVDTGADSTGSESETGLPEEDMGSGMPMSCHRSGAFDIGFQCTCNVVEQDCENGLRCSVDSNIDDFMPGVYYGGVFCTDRGTHELGAPCDHGGFGLGDSCLGAAICWEIDYDSGKGTCHRACASPNDCDADQGCGEFFDGLVPVCMDRCDPRDGLCDAGRVCARNGNDFLCSLSEQAGAGVGEPCAEQACEAGAACHQGTCRALCDIEAPDCEMDLMCIGYSAEPLPHLSDIGVCI